MTKQEAIARIESAGKRLDAFAARRGLFEEGLAPPAPEPEPDAEDIWRAELARRETESWEDTQARWWEAQMRLTWPSGRRAFARRKWKSTR